MQLNEKMKVQLLFTSLSSLTGVVFYILFKLPFDTLFLWAMLFSSLMHLFFYIIFKRLSPTGLALMGYVNIILMGMVIHSTGGVLSPYTVIFAAILISNITFGIATRWDLPLVIGVYLSVVGLEYFGVITKPSISTYMLYDNSPATIIAFMASVLMFLFMAGYLEKIIVRNLEDQLFKEHEKNEAYKEQITKVNSTYHIGFMSAQLIHEIRNPLTAINAFIAISLKEGKMEPQLREDLQSVSSVMNHFNDLVNKLSKFVKPGDGEKGELSLNELVDISIAVLKMDPLYKYINYVKNYDTSKIFSVYGCREEILQVFYNLLKNAADAIQGMGSQKGIIEVTMEDSGEYIKSTVKDNGKGMDLTVLKNTFENFFTTKKQGMGLGMGIVKSILDSHKTELHIKSEPGKGSEMSFLLPKHSPVKELTL